MEEYKKLAIRMALGIETPGWSLSQAGSSLRLERDSGYIDDDGYTIVDVFFEGEPTPEECDMVASKEAEKKKLLGQLAELCRETNYDRGAPLSENGQKLLLQLEEWYEWDENPLAQTVRWCRGNGVLPLGSTPWYMWNREMMEPHKGLHQKTWSHKAQVFPSFDTPEEALEYLAPRLHNWLLDQKPKEGKY